MSRIIKFRGWDKDGKYWMSDEWVRECMLNYKGDRIEFSQFCGLTDKNGKEIYEGDVIASKAPRYTSNGVVSWVPEWGRWMLCARQKETGKNFVEGAGVFKSREVIGNVYENPELLTPGV
jgi:uncharacterized phage protein (TIGR01671 family)